ncbi:MAG: BlaI/MecI/CopY family transcriptional regulator [Deltaproteobacteria bacterium]
MPGSRSRLPQLGELELAVLEHLWKVDEADVQETHRALGRRRGISVNTVGSALERLFKKTLVVREKVSHAYRYRAALTRETFKAQRMLDAAGGARVLREAGLLSAFVDLVAGEDSASLDRLEALIEKKRREQEGE